MNGNLEGSFLDDFFGMERAPQFFGHIGILSKRVVDLWNAYMKKLILTPVTKNFEVWANLWMLATLASQIPILSFGVASAWIGIFPIRSLRSLIGKILPIPSQFFVTGVKNWYCCKININFLLHIAVNACKKIIMYHWCY